ncbi:hypothetical protein CerSpe_077880 [Prunus speciosa]
MDDKSCYFDICEQLNNHYENFWNRHVATLKRVYFKDLWTGSSTVLGVVVLVFSVIGTIKSLMSVEDRDLESSASKPLALQTSMRTFQWTRPQSSAGPLQTVTASAMKLICSIAHSLTIVKLKYHLHTHTHPIAVASDCSHHAALHVNISNP